MRVKKKPAARTGSLFDRLACALFSGISSVILGSVIWWGFTWKIGPAIPFDLIVYFALFMSVLGFALQDNVVADLIGGLFTAILSIAKW